MAFEPLTPNAEKILQELIDHRFENGVCDFDYWKKRFANCSVADDVLLRSIFKELEDAEMIKTSWGDDVLHYCLLQNRGISYFEIKQKQEQKEKEEKHATTRHDLLMLLIGAVIGGLINFLLFKFFGIGG